MENKQRRTQKTVRARPSRQSRFLSTPEDRHEFLVPLMEVVDSFGKHVVATVHVNGPAVDGSAIVVVDWGAPIDPVRLTHDEQNQMYNAMRDLTAKLFEVQAGERLSIRTSHDKGVYWTSL